MQTSIT